MRAAALAWLVAASAACAAAGSGDSFGHQAMLPLDAVWPGDDAFLSDLWNPGLLVDGAFYRRPFSSGRYGFKFNATSVEIPESSAGDAAAPPGRMTWLDVAACCAATPRSSSAPEVDHPQPRAFAPPPAARCLSYQELAAEPPKTYRDDVEPAGLAKSPCRQHHPAFATNALGDATPRHQQCCAYFAAFMENARAEFEDAGSQALLRRVAALQPATVFELARLMLRLHELWRANVCRDAGAYPTGACCADCVEALHSKWAASGADTPAAQACQQWCPAGMADRLEQQTTGVRNAAMLVDGMFNARPSERVRSGLTVTVSRGVDGASSFALPDHDGGLRGQQSWVAIARCCAATPRESSQPAVDLPQAAALAGPPSLECIAAEQLRELSAAGQLVAPCREQNAGYYHNATTGAWTAKHPLCCAFVSAFLKAAPAEFVDERSQLLLAVVGREPSVFARARKLVQLAHRFRGEVCATPQGEPSDRCCRDCASPHARKLQRLADASVCAEQRFCSVRRLQGLLRATRSWEQRFVTLAAQLADEVERDPAGWTAGDVASLAPPSALHARPPGPPSAAAGRSEPRDQAPPVASPPRLQLGSVELDTLPPLDMPAAEQLRALEAEQAALAAQLAKLATLRRPSR